MSRGAAMATDKLSACEAEVEVDVAPDPTVVFTVWDITGKEFEATSEAKSGEEGSGWPVNVKCNLFTVAGYAAT